MSDIINLPNMHKTTTAKDALPFKTMILHWLKNTLRNPIK